MDPNDGYHKGFSLDTPITRFVDCELRARAITALDRSEVCLRRHCGEVRWLYVVQPGNSVDAAMAEALGVVCQYYSDVCDCDWQEVPR